MSTEEKIKTKKGIPNIIGNFLLFTLVLVLMFGFCEVIVRVLFVETTVLFPRYHTDAQYGEYTLRKIRPKSKFTHSSIDGSWDFEINAQGFRNYKDFSYTKPAGTIRVISLGDSHTQGFEVRQDFTFSSIIEKNLNLNGYKVEVINTGVAGFSNAEQLVLLEQELWKYNPDFIVLGFFANDFEDNIKAALFGLDENNNLVAKSKRSHIPGVGIQNIIYEIPGIQFLSENSYFYSMLFNSVWRWAKAALAQKSQEKVMEVAIPTKVDFSNYEHQLAAALVEKIFSVTKQIGAKLIILDIPTLDRTDQAVPSINDEFYELIRDDNDYFISSKVLSDYDGLDTIHVLHGHRHISEFTHILFGVNVAQYIQSTLKLQEGNPVKAIAQ